MSHQLVYRNRLAAAMVAPQASQIAGHREAQMSKLKLLLLVVLVLYAGSWFSTIPEIHKLQTNGAIDTVAPEQTIPIQGEGMSFGSLHSKAYAITPFYYYGQVSRRFTDKDGYPEMHRYVGVGSYLVVWPPSAASAD